METTRGLAPWLRTTGIIAALVGGLGWIAKIVIMAARAVGAVVVAVLITTVGQAGLSALPGESSVQEEAIFGIAGVVAVLAAVITATHGRADRKLAVR